MFSYDIPAVYTHNMYMTTELKEAIEEYLKDTATPYQQELVNNWYRSFNDEYAEVTLDTATEGKETVEQRIRQRIACSIHQPASKVVEMFPAPGKSKRRRWLVAACITAACAALWLLLPITIKRPAVLIARTGLGETKEVILPDSSLIWLNAMSSISYPANFLEDKREVTIQGEVFFDIKHQQGKSFVVHSGKINTTVLGTAFTVNSYQPDEQIVVTVMRGKVQVSDQTVTSGILTPGKQLSYTPGTGEMKESEKKIMAEPPWMQGKLEFDAMPLIDITATLSRWYSVSFEFENEALRHCNYTGFFTKDMKLKTVLELFSQINNITYKINKDETKVTLSGRGCN